MSLFKKSILLVAAFAQFSSVLFTGAAMAQTASTVAATALPTGGVVRAGAATISGGGTQTNPGLTINQTTNRAAIDWNTLTYGAGNLSNTFAGSIIGTGNVVITGTGTQNWTAANTYTGSTTINAGATLQVGSGTGGSIDNTSLITDNGTLQFGRTNAGLVIGTNIVGSGAVRQIGGGTTTLSGNNSGFTGTATVTAGTLIMGSPHRRIEDGGDMRTILFQL